MRPNDPAPQNSELNMGSLDPKEEACDQTSEGGSSEMNPNEVQFDL